MNRKYYLFVDANQVSNGKTVTISERTCPRQTHSNLLTVIHNRWYFLSVADAMIKTKPIKEKTIAWLAGIFSNKAGKLSTYGAGLSLVVAFDIS